MCTHGNWCCFVLVGAVSLGSLCSCFFAIAESLTPFFFVVIILVDKAFNFDDLYCDLLLYFFIICTFILYYILNLGKIGILFTRFNTVLI